jgi:hypothetical protein
VSAAPQPRVLYGVIGFTPLLLADLVPYTAVGALYAAIVVLSCPLYTDLADADPSDTLGAGVTP